uniref:CACTA en-spm transposon protein n=1 Tax=Cucumis melo TaxID=3656 RepID=A0A9I9E997_CUCME
CILRDLPTPRHDVFYRTETEREKERRSRDRRRASPFRRCSAAVRRRPPSPLSLAAVCHFRLCWLSCSYDSIYSLNLRLFVLDFNDQAMNRFVEHQMLTIFKEFRADCHRHFKKYSDPEEARANPPNALVGRDEDWHFLCAIISAVHSRSNHEQTRLLDRSSLTIIVAGPSRFYNDNVHYVGEKTSEKRFSRRRKMRRHRRRREYVDAFPGVGKASRDAFLSTFFLTSFCTSGYPFPTYFAFSPTIMIQLG